MNKLLAHIQSLDFFKSAVYLTVLTELLDVLTSLVSTKFFGAQELNAYLADPHTGAFLVGRALLIKFFYVLCICALPAWMLKRLTKNWGLASIPFLLNAYHTLIGPDLGNLAVIFSELVRRIT